MKNHKRGTWHIGVSALALAFLTTPAIGLAEEARDLLTDALSAAWPGMAEGAHLMVPIGSRDE